MSFAKKAYAYFDGLPPWAKGVTAVGLLAVSYFAAKGIIDRVKANAQNKNYRESVKNAQQDLSQLLKSGAKLSYSQSVYNGYVSTLKSAFDGWGTSTSHIYSVMNMMKNNADVLQLIIAYGIQTIKGGWMQSDYTSDLPGALAEECDSIEMWGINKILRDNGVTYQFAG